MDEMGFERTAKELSTMAALEKYISGVKFDSMRWNSTEGDCLKVLFFPSRLNKEWSKGSYYNSGRSTFIHYTSLNALESIIKERAIRLYNINNMKDPREFSYAANLVGVTRENELEAKENLYILSMCSSSILRSKTENEFNLWRLYGDDGKGVAIELEFSPREIPHWSDYFLSSVVYGDTGRISFKRVKEIVEDHKDKNTSISLDLSRLACFHKSALFKLEQEVRLLFDFAQNKNIGTTTYSNPLKNFTSPITRTDITKSVNKEKKIKYLELPVLCKGDKDCVITRGIAIPEIKRIILGYGFKEYFKQAKAMIEDHCHNHLGYLPKIEQSRLTKYYYGLESVVKL